MHACVRACVGPEGDQDALGPTFNASVRVRGYMRCTYWCQSANPRVSLCVHASVRPSVHVSMQAHARACMPLSAWVLCLPVHGCIRASVQPSLQPSLRPSIHLRIRASVCPSFHASMHPCVRPCVRLCVCASARVCVRPCVRTFVCVTVHKLMSVHSCFHMCVWGVSVRL